MKNKKNGKLPKTLLGNILLVAFLVMGLLVPSVSTACTSFIVSGRATKDGRPLIFKNRDTGDQNNVIVVGQGELYRYMGIAASWDKKPVEIWGGHNEAGFAIINTAAYNMNGCEGKDTDNDGRLMRRALEVCRTLADFEHLLDTLPQPLGLNSNFGVLDGEGGCAYYETGHYKYVKFDANNPQEAPDGYLVRTNHGLTGCRDIDRGVERFMAISDFMAEACRKENLDCEYLIANVPRYLTHGLTKQNLYEQLPKDENDTRYIHFSEFIPRYITSSALLVQGVKPGETTSHTISWTNIGWPCASVAIPLILEDDVPLPSIVRRGENDKSWLCTKSIEQKKQVFNLKRGNVRDYIDLSKLVNAAGTGIVQRIMPLEREVFNHAREALKKVRKGKGAQTLREYYEWVDEYVKEHYPAE
ncbi:MAG: acyl-CoA--6-aminopenicillanic acid acyl-transferase [Bacteroidaceae bacterium]|nr:acyl-CoA--6-aminopenicillanic acid acyl-transferase [Bacteroidaceae bacterium]